MNGSRRLEMYTSDEKVGLAKDLMRAFNVAWIRVVVSAIAVARQRGQDALGGLARAPVRAREEVQRVIGPQYLAQPSAGIVGLLPALGRQLHPMVGDGLVDLAVF